MVDRATETGLLKADEVRERAHKIAWDEAFNDLIPQRRHQLEGMISDAICECIITLCQAFTRTLRGATNDD